MGCFVPADRAVLKGRALQQIWCDHLLAESMLAHYDDGCTEGEEAS
ncbi:MAG: hypothetical protein JWP97_4073 [Labilithrix sp.]|nr:hypothetical protein [Labilithrix sp.]